MINYIQIFKHSSFLVKLKIALISPKVAESMYESLAAKVINAVKSIFSKAVSKKISLPEFPEKKPDQHGRLTGFYRDDL